MSLSKVWWLSGVLALGLLAGTGPAQAQDDEVSGEEEQERVPHPSKVKRAPGPEAEQELLGDEQARQEERHKQEDFRETTDPHEDPSKRYAFLGVRWSYMALTPTLLKAYTVKSGPTVTSTQSFAAELAFRRKGFQVTTAVGFMKLAANGPFRLKGDPIEDTEWLDINFKLLNLTTAITWSTTFADWFSIEYGLELGIGFLFGDMIRTEAYRDRNGNWGRCQAWASQTTNSSNRLLYNPDFPDPTPEQRRYCAIPDGPSNQPPPATNGADEEGEQYGVKAKTGVFTGGVPRAIPILGPRLSLRFKPVHQFVIRVDLPLPSLPFGIMGGVAVQYGF